MLAGGPHPHPDAMSPVVVGQELWLGEAGAPPGNAKHCLGSRAEKPPTPHPAPAPMGLRATRGDKSKPTRGFSGGLTLPAASFQGRGRMHPLRICRSRPARLAWARNGTWPLANTAWSKHGAAPGGSLARGCATRRQETPLFHFSHCHRAGGNVGLHAAPSAPCRLLPRAEAKGLAGVRGPIHSRFSFLWHAGC